MRRAVLTALLLLPALAWATCVMHLWSAGDVIQPADINANFSCIINSMVGQAGARLVDSDVSPGAAINRSKLDLPQLIPKAWLIEGAACAGGAANGTACATPQGSSRMTLSSTGTTGQYWVNFSFNPPLATFAIGCTPIGTADETCLVVSSSFHAGQVGQNVQIRIFNQAGVLLDSDVVVWAWDVSNN